jgi:orotidine-5'-phosphate decarboxylase
MKYLRDRRKRIVVAIDDPNQPPGYIEEIIAKTYTEVVGFKFGIPYILRHGLQSIARIMEKYSNTYYLADLKLSDIGAVMSKSVEVVKSAGFDGVVAHSVIGYAGALDELSRSTKQSDIDLVLQTTMTHSGSISTLDTLIQTLIEVINIVDPDALIAPATKTDTIKKLRNVFGRRYPILSPGIRIQGAQPGSGICAGADAEIVGRAIIMAPDPLKAVQDIAAAQEEYLRSRKECSEGS